jgi:hypothetical protein
MGLSSHQSARMKNDEWLTPPRLLYRLGEFDLDPCAPVNRPWPTAKHHFTVKDDGLSRKWFGRVWLNPPFGREAAKWLEKMAEHGNGIALVAARTETRMFFNSVWGKANTVCFVKGRPHFHYVTGRRAAFNSGAPICLIAYGLENACYLWNSGLGHTMPCRMVSKMDRRLLQ